MSRRKKKTGLLEGVAGLVGLGVAGVVAVGSALFGKRPDPDDTTVDYGDTFFRGRYTTVKGKCFRCDGSGFYHGETCRKCGGSGRYERTTWYR